MGLPSNQLRSNHRYYQLPSNQLPSNQENPYGIAVEPVVNVVVLTLNVRHTDANARRMKDFTSRMDNVYPSRNSSLELDVTKRDAKGKIKAKNALACTTSVEAMVVSVTKDIK